MFSRSILLAAFAAACAAPAAADPLASEAWADIVALEFEGETLVHDESFHLVVPERVRRRSASP